MYFPSEYMLNLPWLTDFPAPFPKALKLVGRGGQKGLFILTTQREKQHSMACKPTNKKTRNIFK